MKLTIKIALLFLPFLCYGEEQYQDIIINNVLVSPGSRQCATRYAALEPLLKKFNRPFTVLDIGASQGFFSFKIAADYPNAVAVMIEGNYQSRWHTAERLLELCQKNTILNNIIFLQKHITINDLERLGKTEHFDVVLAFNIIHHFKDQWKEAADAVFNLGDHIIIETPPSNDKVFANNTHIKDLENYLHNKQGTVIAQTPRHTDPSALASMYYFEQQKKSITHKHWFFGTPADGITIKYEIVSDFEQKQFIKTKPDQIIDRPWQPGINFITFKALNGVWPSQDIITQALLDFKHEQHGDLLPWNIIIGGKQLVTIDNDGEFYSDPARALLYTLQFNMLTDYKQLHSYFLHEPHPSNWKETKRLLWTRGICADMSYGELIDKITILELKEKYTSDQHKLRNIKHELVILKTILDKNVTQIPELAQLTQELYDVNHQLWHIEDKIRIKEKRKEFDNEFVELARSVYFTNDVRAALKRAINDLLGSEIIEEKIYEQYKRSIRMQ